MNADSHTHDLKVRYQHKHDWHLRVEYGDQTKLWPQAGPLLDLRRRRKVRKMVERHDRESLKAGRRRDAPVEMTKRYASVAANVAGQAWERTEKT